ncbi:MAG TPA: hypothetical protein VHA82_06100 [Ramlibacter sp.]|uniref:hypothetical protein n=1 Tax=Ramlibacter sp. TaxID=1917967 RepID=UPI002C5C9C2B|nr:hypothetical protein [Ramlibacter sp.]HVZ43365.1 hypothetical protein [Ramlibacter sp.]
MSEVAVLLGLDAGKLLEAGAVESDGVQFHFQHHTHRDPPIIGILAELDEVPEDDASAVFRRLLEANAHLSPEAGTYALVPGSRRAALRLSVPLVAGTDNARRIVDMLGDHIAARNQARAQHTDRPHAQPGELLSNNLV